MGGGDKAGAENKAELDPYWATVLCSQAKMTSCQWRGPNEELEAGKGLDALGFMHPGRFNNGEGDQIGDTLALETCW